MLQIISEIKAPKRTQQGMFNCSTVHRHLLLHVFITAVFNILRHYFIQPHLPMLIIDQLQSHYGERLAWIPSALNMQSSPLAHDCSK